MALANITEISILALPMRTKFRGIQTREIALIKGNRWSEFSPFVEYPDSEAVNWLHSALSFANDPLPEKRRNRIPINATLPAVRPEQIKETLTPFGNFETVKVKVAEAGQSIEEDVARIQETRKLFPAAKVRLDANGGYTVQEALKVVKELDQEFIEYFEQPVSSIPELKDLRQLLQAESINLKIAADESIRKAEDPLLVAKEKAADIAVLKAQPLGGITKALEIAKQVEMEVVISSALESSIGVLQGLYLAAALPELNYACGLGTASLLAGDVVIQPLLPTDGHIDVREINPDPELIEKYSASTERRDWWLERIERCEKLLEA